MDGHGEQELRAEYEVPLILLGMDMAPGIHSIGLEHL